MTRVLYNPLANNRRGLANAKQIEAVLTGEALTFVDITEIRTLSSYLAEIPAEDRVVLAGGDGTINRFINDLGGEVPARDIYYFPAGSGNDFMADIRLQTGETELVLLNPYLADLPTVTINGETRFFLNGIGFGIDGYCCEEGDKKRAKSDKPVNYTAIAIKGLLYAFKPVNATVTVDGVSHAYKKVWIAPTMNGRFYGGGMMVAPAQERTNQARSLTTVLMHGKGKLKTLMVFPSIFKGEHVKHPEMVAMHEGQEITVTFDRPCALQIDGETVLGVTSYTCRSCKVQEQHVNEKVAENIAKN